MRPRLAFLGVGWIGRQRLQAVAEWGGAEITHVADASPEVAAEVAATVGAEVADVDALLDGEVGADGLVIATPSGLHAEQAQRALAAGQAVACQKPLARDEAETRAVVEAARRADRLLAVDLSYRFVAAARVVHDVVRRGDIGDVYAADLVFHNAYGPDKTWATDRATAGGGCVIDLGTHLVDLALWALDRPEVAAVSSRLFAGGRPLSPATDEVEDHAEARIDLAHGATVALACSWHASLGRGAAIEATFRGTAGTASFRNVDGSFYDFTAELWKGDAREVLVAPPDAWGGRAITAWAARLGDGATYDEDVEDVLDVAHVIDRIYAR